MKQNAIAMNDAGRVIGGSSVLRRSGQGRRSRADVAVIFAASQRLSVSVICATATAAAGARLTSASTQCSASSLKGASRGSNSRSKPRRSTAVIEAASLPSVSRAAIVLRVAKPAIHKRMRPTGYHSRSSATTGGASGDEVPTMTGRPSKARWPSHHAGSATVITKAIP